MTRFAYKFLESPIHRAIPHLPEQPRKALLHQFREQIYNQPGTLNKQQERERIFKGLLEAYGPTAVIETGTYLGAGSKFFLENTHGPIMTCEINDTYFDFSKERFKGESRVSVYQGHSLEFLDRISEKAAPKDTKLFFYLDAHWEDDLPLRKEVEYILKRWPNAMIAIDDFAVPHDNGYRYDDYGATKVLNADYLKDLPVKTHMFYPAINSREETGAKRGCCFICQPNSVAHAVLTSCVDLISSSESLRRAESSNWVDRSNGSASAVARTQ